MRGRAPTAGVSAERLPESDVPPHFHVHPTAFGLPVASRLGRDAVRDDTNVTRREHNPGVDTARPTVRWHWGSRTEMFSAATSSPCECRFPVDAPETP